MFEMKKLDFEMSALEPYMSAKTFEFHYGKHYKGYLDKLNELILGSDYEKLGLEDIIKTSYAKGDKAVYNNASQVWNHEFFWNSMSAKGGVEPSSDILNKIIASFGSYDNFKKEFKQKALGQFGSGWCWVVEKDGKLSIIATSNADNPISLDLGKALVCIDVWEHAYYLDYQNRRADFIDSWLAHLLKW